MIRKQVQVTERQATRVRREAGRRGISESAVIREALDRGLGGDTSGPTDEQWEGAFAAVGMARSGLTDLALEHDRYLAEDLHEEIVEKRRLWQETRGKRRSSRNIR